jgi:hypothetical protein
MTNGFSAIEYIILMTIFFIVILTWFNCGCYGNQSVINSKSNGQNKLLAKNITLLGEFQKTIGKSKKGKIDTSNIHIHDHSLELVYWDQTFSLLLKRLTSRKRPISSS